MTRLRAAVIGLGWAGEQHMSAWAARDDVELVGIAGLEPDRRAELANRYGVLSTAGSTELLDRAEPHVLSIATPTALHAPMAVEALSRGIHVLTEKPMAVSAEAADRMVAAARAAGAVCDVVFNHRLRGEVRALAQGVATGALGEIRYARAGWMRRAGIPGAGSWFTRAELSGGGALADLGVHVLDIALELLGRPRVRYVSGTTAAQFGPRGLGISGYASGADEAAFDVEDLAVATIVADGVTLGLEAGWAQLREQDRCYVELHGSHGGAFLELGKRPSGVAPLTIVTGDPSAPRVETPAFGEPLRHAGVIEEFVRKVEAGAAPGRFGEGARDLTAVVDACYVSARTCAPVPMDA